MIPSSNSPQNPNVKTFFNTHDSPEVYTLPGLTEEELTKLQIITAQFAVIPTHQLG